MDDLDFYVLEKYFESQDIGLTWGDYNRGIASSAEFISLEYSKIGTFDIGYFLRTYTQSISGHGGDQKRCISELGKKLYLHEVSIRNEKNRKKKLQEQISISVLAANRASKWMARFTGATTLFIFLQILVLLSDKLPNMLQSLKLLNKKQSYNQDSIQLSHEKKYTLKSLP